MKRFLILALALFIFQTQSDAQKVFATRNGQITFSAPSDDDVKAVNNEVTSRVADNGQITFSLLVKGFKFKYAEMQEHFNDQYMESQRFPRADFRGNILNLNDVYFSKNGSYTLTVKGDLSMHGVTKNITANGTMEVKDGKLTISTQFALLMKDFSVDASSITEKVSVDLSCHYQ